MGEDNLKREDYEADTPWCHTPPPRAGGKARGGFLQHRVGGGGEGVGKGGGKVVAILNVKIKKLTHHSATPPLAVVSDRGGFLTHWVWVVGKVVSPMREKL